MPPLLLPSQMNKLVTELALYDIGGVAGVGADISHCNTPVKARGAMRFYCSRSQGIGTLKAAA